MPLMMKAEPNTRAWSPAALAEKWGVSRDVIYDLLLTGELKGFKVGRHWRISAKAVDQYEEGR